MPAAITPSTDLTSIKLKQNERSRALAEALIARAFRERPNAQQVGNGVVTNHWTNNLADVLSAGLGAYQARKLDEQELDLVKTQNESDSAELARVLGGGLEASSPAAPPMRPPMALPSMGGPPPAPVAPMQSAAPPQPRVLPPEDLNARLGPLAAPAAAAAPAPGPVAPAAPAAGPNPTGIPPRAQAMLEQLGAQEEQLSNTLRQYTYLAATNPRLSAGLESPIKVLSDQLKGLNDAKFKIIGELSDPNFGIDYQSMNDQGFAMSGGVATPTVDARTVYSAPVAGPRGSVTQAEARTGGKVEQVVGPDNSTNITTNVNNPKGEDELSKRLGALLGEAAATARTNMLAAPQKLRVIEDLQRINDQVTFTGPAAQWGVALSGFADSMGMPLSTELRAKLNNTQEYNAGVYKQIFDEINELGAARSMTNEDMKAFTQIFANPNLTREARSRILRNQHASALRGIEGNRQTLRETIAAQPPGAITNLLQQAIDVLPTMTADEIRAGAR